MSEIFISYASADREQAKTVAEGLSAEGWSVWWDRVIPPGRQFDEVIEEALDAARCVVVLWTRASVASNWVKTEAAEAMRRKILIPALLEDVRIPLEFRRLQAADLSHWEGDRADPAWLQFVESVAAEVKRIRDPQVPPPNEPAHRPRHQEPQRVEKPPAGPGTPVRPHLFRTKRSAVLIGGVMAAVLVIVGTAFYAGRVEHVPDLKTIIDRAAFEELQRQRDFAAPDEPLRPDQQREIREVLEPMQRELDARKEALRAERERSAREDAPRGAEQRRADESRGARQRGSQYAVPESGVANLQWRDSALRFSGTFTWSPSTAVLRAAVVDLKTGVPIGNYAVPARVSQQGPLEYLVSAEFLIPADSTTPGPHTHTSRLLLRAEQDGSVRMVQNCPRPGECY